MVIRFSIRSGRADSIAPRIKKELAGTLRHIKKSYGADDGDTIKKRSVTRTLTSIKKTPRHQCQPRSP